MIVYAVAVLATFDELGGRFDPMHVLAGEFTAEDVNDDGVIDYGELESLQIYGDMNYKECQGQESPYFSCGVGPFYFGPGDELSFSLGVENHDRPRLTGRGHTIDTGDRDWRYTIVNGVIEPSSYYKWTDATTLQIMVVPEPGGWAMLASGVAWLLGSRRMHRHVRRPAQAPRRRVPEAVTGDLATMASPPDSRPRG